MATAMLAGTVLIAACSSPSPSASSPTTPAVTTPTATVAPLETKAPVSTSVPTGTAGSSAEYVFQGYHYRIAATITANGPTQPINGCQDDAPPGKTNINFTVTVTNTLTDRHSPMGHFVVGTIDTTEKNVSLNFEAVVALIYPDPTSCLGGTNQPTAQDLGPGQSFTYNGQIRAFSESKMATFQLGIQYQDDAKGQQQFGLPLVVG